MVRVTKKTEEQPEKKKTVVEKGCIYAVGRRREAIARVRLYPDIKEEMRWGDMVLEKGKMYVNQKPIEQYFSSTADKVTYMAPFQTTNTRNSFTVTAKIVGGGNHGQLEALVHGIARALAAYDVSIYRSPLKKKGFLTRDPRAKERRKVGMGGKSRREKQSPKR